MKTTVHVFTGEGISAMQASGRAQTLANDWLKADYKVEFTPAPTSYTVTTNSTLESEDGVYSFTITIVRRGY